MEKAYFGAGCFWGVEAQFKEIPGVLDTTVGYGGGHTINPSYEQVCEDSTGHAELVEVVYDESQVVYQDLVKAFFSMHNPTTLNRQGMDVGSQYRSVIYTTRADHQKIALQIKSELEMAKKFSSPIVTLIEPFVNFYPAEDYHQDYSDKHPGVCHI